MSGRHIAGVALTLVLAIAAWAAHIYYGLFLDALSSLGLGILRPWAEDLRWPILGLGGALILGAVAAAWRRAGLGT